MKLSSSSITGCRTKTNSFVLSSTASCLESVEESLSVNRRAALLSSKKNVLELDTVTIRERSAAMKEIQLATNGKND